MVTVLDAGMTTNLPPDLMVRRPVTAPCRPKPHQAAPSIAAPSRSISPTEPTFGERSYAAALWGWAHGPKDNFGDFLRAMCNGDADEIATKLIDFNDDEVTQHIAPSSRSLPYTHRGVVGGWGRERGSAMSTAGGNGAVGMVCRTHV